ncbi:uncharacterized protein BXZ73DRAFT_103907 [Epithele typhae]|uniref:uncharacterized protein n=1 Tax=Epithele typhae TaxID=378194 RepID=UPI00200892C0|nr:uncharacterized protein BXZ73DRAFT_103907 [Epithele typhae]KAH9923474.1 hypothetical protein BXZ73DRAFT_103907 [Epithele typhae]
MSSRSAIGRQKWATPAEPTDRNRRRSPRGSSKESKGTDKDKDTDKSHSSSHSPSTSHTPASRRAPSVASSSSSSSRPWSRPHNDSPVPPLPAEPAIAVFGAFDPAMFAGDARKARERTASQSASTARTSRTTSSSSGGFNPTPGGGRRARAGRPTQDAARPKTPPRSHPENQPPTASTSKLSPVEEREYSWRSTGGVMESPETPTAATRHAARSFHPSEESCEASSMSFVSSHVQRESSVSTITTMGGSWRERRQRDAATRPAPAEWRVDFAPSWSRLVHPGRKVEPPLERVKWPPAEEDVSVVDDRPLDPAIILVDHNLRNPLTHALEVLLVAHDGSTTRHDLGSSPVPLALHPSRPSLRLFHQDLPWFLYVDPAPSPAPAPTLTLAALLTALHAHLHAPIAAEDYYNAALSHSARVCVASACSVRRGGWWWYARPEGVLDICRIDFLMDRGRLWGLRKVPGEEGEEGEGVGGTWEVLTARY